VAWLDLRLLALAVEQELQRTLGKILYRCKSRQSHQFSWHYNLSLAKDMN